MAANGRQGVRRLVLTGVFLLFPVTFYYFSPVVILAAAFAGIASGSLFLFSAQAISALVAGRAFCGWACPVGGLSEWLSSIYDRRAAGGQWNWLKWPIWVPWVAMFVVLAIRAGGLRTADPLYMMPSGLPLSEWSGAIAYLVVLALVVLLTLAAGRRAFCHYVCWMAPGMILGTRLSRLLSLPRLHLTAHSDSCTGCQRCDRVCPMSLSVSAMVARGSMRDDECILCQSCVDTCPTGSIEQHFGRFGE